MGGRKGDREAGRETRGGMREGRCEARSGGKEAVKYDCLPYLNFNFSIVELNEMLDKIKN